MNQRISYFFWGALAIAGAVHAASDDIAQTPLSVTQTIRPMVMLALSNDHQLYRKAYNDYSDLDGDGSIDTTYNNLYSYYGYFDSNKCYTYTSGYFNPTAMATEHQCSNAWSGNLLNWAAMTRMDILRKVLYGGFRSTDTATPDLTILERVLLPTDAHAFAKVFAPPGGADDMALYTPYRDEKITFCNVTYATSGQSQSLDTSVSPPLIRIATGAWPMWSSGEVVECAWYEERANATAPKKTNAPVSFKAELNARVAVCVSDLIEDNCRGYKDDSDVTHMKPIGLLQKYGDNGSLRFGLMSGSYKQRMSGGVLRRKIGLLAGNTVANAAQNEINLLTGQFTGHSGIIKSINAFRINKYDYTTHNYQDSCASPGMPICATSSSTGCYKNGVCTNWGNPIAEIYMETLRYFAGKLTATPAYDADDSSYFSALTKVSTWGDPMPETDWCAKCNLIFLSTAVNSFDRDEFATDIVGLDLTAASNAVGTADPIGNSLILGGSGTTKQCTAKSTTGLAVAQGVCPEGPTLDGGYLVAGAAYFAHTNGLRRVKDQQQMVNTQTVALARDLPRFNIAVGSDTVTLLPHLEANTTTTAVQATSGWRMGSLVDLSVENLVKNTAGKLVGGSLLVIWEDSTWGNDFDMDGAQRLKFCAGPSAGILGEPNPCQAFCTACTETECPTTCEKIYTACGTTDTCKNNRTNCLAACTATANCKSDCSTVAANQIRITSSAEQVYAGHALLFGYTITGTSAGTSPTNAAGTASTLCDGAYHQDGVYREVVRKDGKNFSMLTTPVDTPANKPAACVRMFTAGSNPARLLEPALWYAAKYGGFTDVNANAKPDLATEWDSNDDDTPDRFFYADNPALLGTSLERFLEVIATISSSASVVANSITLNEDTRIFQGRYDSSDWSGDVVAFPVNTDGSLSTLIWSGRTEIDAQATAGTRRIITSNEERRTVTGGPGVPFRWGNDDSDDNDGIAQEQKEDLGLQPCWGTTCAAVHDAKGEARLNYLRGSHAAETSQTGGTLRTRAHVLGDVVNSDPVYIGAPMSLYPDTLEEHPYRTFAAAKADRQPIVYVGANDGMIHGFNADTGAELFAYVPRAVYPKLSALTAVDYRDHHQSFVDGGAVAGDVYLRDYLGEEGAWRTLLLGSLGAGGRGVFAIDVTNPADFAASEETAATRVLWDIVGGDDGGDGVHDFDDLGYTYSRPVAARMPDTVLSGAWVVVFGNGYKSPDGKAVLYVVDAKTGTLLSSVVADAGPGNGLSSVAPVDYDGDGRVDYLYAGDLKGNLWRFEPSVGSDMQVSFAGVPLFSDLTGLTGTTSPITVRPEVMRHPMRGVVVLFGSGAYFREGDRIPNTTAINAFYGIWDRFDGTSAIAREHLLKQQILAKTVSGAFDVRVTTDNPITWRLDSGKPTDSPPTTHLGWYLELRQPLDGTAEGEVQVTDPQLRGGRVIFTSLIPSDPGTALCDFGGDGWLIELNALNGARRTEVVFDLNADTVFNLADMVSVQVNGAAAMLAPSGKKSTVGIIQEPAIIGAGTKEYKFASGAREAAIEITVENPGDLAGGRRSWLQLH
ncbi:pilus assembly protein [Candidatus Thiodictyon syntrophicum]|jgi:type IV pilus assembly protein PilY1|uniref:PilY1 beta-propeller domain-containing protein n=1 Tax=Candidatus Thiodictyon syntrophicum TaxID=1166950 RepID=A0A2K8U8E3_9GAMM|nr:PilC/PilY family type IV pilus protein [Candidatus Thiodictyon syntrophicum]AUB81878.1 hypothetical protein THSYN_13520 [Candidatus Thiodictyon syntrophicum]